MTRNDKIVLAVLEGLQRWEVAKMYHITEGRVAQIFSEWSHKTEPKLWKTEKTHS